MSAMNPDEILDLLQGIETRSRSHASGLPQQLDTRETWEGVVFLMGDEQFIVGVDQVRELLNFPTEVTKVPGTQPWMMGVANVRGDLLPIVDIQQYLGAGTTVVGRRSRVMVVDQEGILVGLHIQDVLGLRTFFANERVEAVTIDSRLGMYISGAFENEDARLNVFDTRLLASDVQFQSAAQ